VMVHCFALQYQHEISINVRKNSYAERATTACQGFNAIGTFSGRGSANEYEEPGGTFFVGTVGTATHD
jgi:hypothetical protein